MRSGFRSFGFAAVTLLSSTTAYGFEAGSLGSAYQDQGYVQGCTADGELPGCTIIAGGSQFVAPADGQTPAEVMDALKALPPLTYVDFNLDILNVYDSYAEVAISFVAPSEKTDPKADQITAMQGEWLSTDDAQSSVLVEGLIWTDLYDGQMMGQSVVFAGSGCADGSGEGVDTIELFVIGSADAGSLCYSVLSVDANRMELSYLARGNTLTFTRAK